jgi:hypothetical protein
MTRNVLTASAIALALLIGGWLAATSSGRSAPLRSPHSEPATAQPPSLVAVTSDGKLYHRPDCAYIHGPIQMESGEQAIAEGYTACTRCLNDRR